MGSFRGERGEGGTGSLKASDSVPGEMSSRGGGRGGECGAGGGATFDRFSELKYLLERTESQRKNTGRSSVVLLQANGGRCV